MKKNKLKIIITSFSILFYFTLFAQGPGGQRGRNGGQNKGGKPDAEQVLSKLDTNNDDKIDLDEASKDKRGKIAQDFDNIDFNDDKYIDLDELKTSLNDKRPKGESAEKIMREADDNADGKLNALEVAAKEKLLLTNNFDTIDANNDNEIDLEELKAFMSKSEKESRSLGPKKRKKRQ